MGTIVTITLYAETEEQAQVGFLAAFRRIEQLNDIFSDYKTDSELSRICATDKPLSPDLMAVLARSQHLAAATGGAFDITAGPVIRVWREARREHRLPDPSALAEAKRRSGYRNLQWDSSSRRATCLTPGMQLDAGGIAKGYAADQALKTLDDLGLGSALVAISGDLRIGDAPPGKSGWRIRVAGKELVLANTAVSTSGDEFQFADIGGVRYSHIIDPRTGEALRNSSPVSVIAPSGMEADSLATAISVLGPEHARELSGSGGIQVLTR